jgi:hypothetical protein
VNRIFLTLAIVSNILLAGATYFGLQIEDPKSIQVESIAGVSRHMLTGMGALCFATLIHAIVLTYFMGTGRWMEETITVYQLDKAPLKEGQTLKYKAVIWMVVSISFLLGIGAFGAAADPASAVGFKGWFGIPPATLHFFVVCVALSLNFLVNMWEYQMISRNGTLINQIMEQVRKIRLEKGLAV